MKKVLSVLFLFASFCNSTYAQSQFESESLSTEASLSSVERNVRNAAVKVITSGGHGSGTYVLIDGLHVILTAQHVADGPIGTNYRIISPDSNETVLGRLVYSDSEKDVAAIYIPEMETRGPMRFNPRKNISNVGDRIVYSGHPSSHSLLSFRGWVSGYEISETQDKILLIHTYGWMGCSGSGIYDSRGRLVGMLWGVSVARYPQQRLVEDIIWATPAHLISKEGILRGICDTSLPKPEMCKD
jgi:S1-C subfamily serine protease